MATSTRSFGRSCRGTPMSSRRMNPWSKINRCIMCGSRLTYIPTGTREALDHEGSKICEHNHKRFTVVGKYNDEGVFVYDFIIPQKAWR